MRASRRLALVLAAAAAPLLAACGPQVVQQVSAKIDCGSESRTMVLMVQSVPTATLVPCIDNMPAGWSFSHIEIRSGMTRFWLNASLARTTKPSVQVTLLPGCIPQGTRIPSDDPPAGEWVKIDTIVDSPRYIGTRYYTFPGGCLEYRFDFPSGPVKAQLNASTSTAIRLIPRQTVEETLAKHGFHL